MPLKGLAARAVLARPSGSLASRGNRKTDDSSPGAVDSSAATLKRRALDSRLWMGHSAGGTGYGGRQGRRVLRKGREGLGRVGKD